MFIIDIVREFDSPIRAPHPAPSRRSSVEESTRNTAGIVASIAFLPPLTSIASTIALQWGHPAVSGEEVRNGFAQPM
ncbi:hypothetical protein [Microcoleus sp. herbarium2]|uniref:hypothetical protein n=1 Tax=Microcoleus sp. herbarium2 TaxID=3055433 RepID=UPI002FD7787E